MMTPPHTSNIAPDLSRYREWFDRYLSQQNEQDTAMLQTA